MYRLERINSGKDIKELYYFMDDNGMISTNDYRLFIVDFSRKLRFEYKDFYIIRYEDESIVGFIGLYEYHIYDNNCIIEAVGDTAALEKVLEDYLIQIHKNYPIKKVYFEVDVDNNDMLKLLTRIGVKKEAMLKEYRFKNGRYCDVIIMGSDLQNAQ